MQKPLFDVIVSAVADNGVGSFNARVVNRYEEFDGQPIDEIEGVEFEEAFEWATDAIGRLGIMS